MNEDELEDFGYTFDELMGKETRIGNARHIRQLSIFPSEVVVLPYEKMTLEVADPILQRMCEDVHRAESLIGISYQPKGSSALPAPGTIGVAAQIQDIIRANPGSHYFVKVEGVVRYKTAQYVETDKPYSVATINYFEDKDGKKARQMHAQLVREFKSLMKRFARDWCPEKPRMQQTADSFETAGAQIYSWLFWYLFPLPPEGRVLILDIKSTATRLAVFNKQFRQKLDRLKDAPKNSYN